MHADGGGLYLQVAEGGSKSWLFRDKLHGRARWHGPGSLCEVNLEDAREKATGARKVRRNGGDPIQARREAEAAARIEAAKAITFGAAAKRFIKANRTGWKNAKHADQWLNHPALPMKSRLAIIEATPSPLPDIIDLDIDLDAAISDQSNYGTAADCQVSSQTAAPASAAARPPASECPGSFSKNHKAFSSLGKTIETLSR